MKRSDKALEQDPSQAKILAGLGHRSDNYDNDNCKSSLWQKLGGERGKVYNIFSVTVLQTTVPKGEVGRERVRERERKREEIYLERKMREKEHICHRGK